MLLGILPALCAIEDDGLDWVVDEYTARTPLDELMEAAENGNADAQYKLWLMYYNGDTVPKNYAEALKWFRRAAEEQGHREAQCQVGYMYHEGISTTQNKEETARWYRRAAAQGVFEEQFSIGLMYYDARV